MIGHQHQLDVFGLRQDVPPPLHRKHSLVKEIEHFSPWVSPLRLQTGCLVVKEEEAHRTPLHPPHPSTRSVGISYSHPVCVGGVVDWRNSSVRNATASSIVTFQRAGGEHQVESSFFINSSSSASSTPMSSTLPRAPPTLSLLVVVFVLRLQLKAQGGVDGDDAAAGGNTVT